MRKKWLGSLAGLLVAAGTAAAQVPAPVTWTIPGANQVDRLPAPADVEHKAPATPPPYVPGLTPPAALPPLTESQSQLPPSTPAPPLPAVPPHTDSGSFKGTLGSSSNGSSNPIVPPHTDSGPFKGYDRVSPPPPFPAAPPPAVTPAVPAVVPPCNGNCGDRLVPQAVGRSSGYVSGSAADVWFDAEYLLWWIKNGRQPALVGTISTADAAVGNVGTITPIYGSSADGTDYNSQSGVRFSAGGWLDQCHTIGLDGSFFQLEHKTSAAQFTSNGDPVIGPIFFDPVRLQQTIILASLPTFSAGPFASSPRSAVINVSNNNELMGFDANGRYQLGALLFMDRLDLIGGFRYLYFGEGLDLTTNSTAATGFPGPNVVVVDHFGTRNQFYGGQLGLSSHGQAGRLSFDGVFKFAMGGVREVVNINGSTSIANPGQPAATFPGGILTQPTNIGHFSTSHFAVLPELTLTLGYQVAPHLRATIGYNFLYLSQVLRAGDQIDGVDGRQVRSLAGFDPTVRTGPPTPTFITDRFYAQGLNFGLEFSY